MLFSQLSAKVYRLESATASTLTLRYTESSGAEYWSKPDCSNSLEHNNTSTEKKLIQENTYYGKFFVPLGSFFQINYYLRDALIKEPLNILEKIQQNTYLTSSAA